MNKHPVPFESPLLRRIDVSQRSDEADPASIALTHRSRVVAVFVHLCRRWPDRVQGLEVPVVPFKGIVLPRGLTKQALEDFNRLQLVRHLAARWQILGPGSQSLE